MMKSRLKSLFKEGAILGGIAGGVAQATVGFKEGILGGAVGGVIGKGTSALLQTLGVSSFRADMSALLLTMIADLGVVHSLGDENAVIPYQEDMLQHHAVLYLVLMLEMTGMTIYRNCSSTLFGRKTHTETSAREVKEDLAYKMQ